MLNHGTRRQLKKQGPPAYLWMNCPICGSLEKVKKTKCPCCGKLGELLKCPTCGDFLGIPDFKGKVFGRLKKKRAPRDSPAAAGIRTGSRAGGRG